MKPLQTPGAMRRLTAAPAGRRLAGGDMAASAGTGSRPTQAGSARVTGAAAPQNFTKTDVV